MIDALLGQIHHTATFAIIPGKLIAAPYIWRFNDYETAKHAARLLCQQENTIVEIWLACGDFTPVATERNLIKPKEDIQDG